MYFRAPKSRNPPFGLAPQAPCRKFQGFLALVIDVVLGIVLESGAGASMRMAVPIPVADLCGLESPPGIDDVPVQAPWPGPGPSRSKHWALAGVWQEHRRVAASAGAVPGWHTRNQHFI